MIWSFRVGTIAGIPVKFDITFLLILPVFGWVIGLQVAELIALLNLALGANIDPEPLTTAQWPWILGFIAAVGLFAGVILHELGHSLIAIRYGYPISSITLWLLGGVAQLERPPRDWRHELWIAIAGPIVSVLVGVGCYLLLLITPAAFPSIRFIFGYLALMNVVLAVFNMLPGFPMDGGRVLRALLARNRSFVVATQQAAEIGKIFAIGMGLLGLIWLNLLLIALAFFIYIAATGESRQILLESMFEGVTVDDVMTSEAELHTVSPDMSIEELLQFMFKHRHLGYPVLDRNELTGVVTFDDIRTIAPSDRGSKTVRDVMATELITIGPDKQAIEALHEMHRRNVGRLLVVDATGDLLGLVSRTDLVRALSFLQAAGSGQFSGSSDAIGVTDDQTAIRR